ncbi:hypothetical protein GDO81_021462 [Engystomops pustulosus]|uniref:Uncharacterized protein n=1 Tax=Engystomops pustulosus TaxID=76066 RepID=A0AAV6Z7V1_ENGPU|nr:hypothetical protein GDO81_021462 [Engystomops pustulosus]
MQWPGVGPRVMLTPLLCLLLPDTHTSLCVTVTAAPWRREPRSPLMYSRVRAALTRCAASSARWESATFLHTQHLGPGLTPNKLDKCPSNGLAEGHLERGQHLVMWD